MWSLTLGVSGCWPQHLWIRQSKSGTSETSKTKLIFFMCFLMTNLSMQVSSWDKNFVTQMPAASPIHVFFFLAFFMSFGFYVAFLPKKHELILFLPVIFVFFKRWKHFGASLNTARCKLFKYHITLKHKHWTWILPPSFGRRLI